MVQKKVDPALEDEVIITKEQAAFLVGLSQEAESASRRAYDRFNLAASAVLAGKAPEGASIVKIDVNTGRVTLNTGGG